MNIHITTIPHSRQRYNTVGDWFYNKTNGHLEIRVSKMGNPSYEFLVIIHELVEYVLCWCVGIKPETVDKFDMEFKGNGEPGDSPNAPYHKQHCIATGVERILAAFLGVSWRDYERKINSLL